LIAFLTPLQALKDLGSNSIVGHHLLRPKGLCGQRPFGAKSAAPKGMGAIPERHNPRNSSEKSRDNTKPTIYQKSSHKNDFVEGLGESAWE
jgi:hypothetical protein